MADPGDVFSFEERQVMWQRAEQGLIDWGGGDKWSAEGKQSRTTAKAVALNVLNSALWPERSAEAQAEFLSHFRGPPDEDGVIHYQA